MIKINLIFLLCCWTILGVAQTTLELNIQHKYEKSTFASGQPYMDANNNVVKISQIQYYLSGIELTHDGGQLTALSNKYVLVDGTQGNYELGTINSTITSLENIQFDLGVDANTNITHPSDYVVGSPLAELGMYSTNENSYVFLMIEGLVDTDGDNVADQPFVFRATAAQLLRTVSVEVQTNANNNVLQINLTADVAKWLEGIDLEQVGVQENAGVENTMLVDNTLDFTVFSNTSTTSVQTLVSPQNHIHVDSRLNFAPTIHYKFHTGEQIDMTITNVTGTYFIQRFEMSPEGDFYMDTNLASGIYIVVFTSQKGIRQCKKFTIVR